MNQNDKNIAVQPNDDLTIVLLRGNGSPKTIRLSVEQIQKAFSTLGIGMIVVAFLIILAFASLWYSEPSQPLLTREQPTQIAPTNPPNQAIEQSSLNEGSQTTSSNSSWIDSIQSFLPGRSQPVDTELKQEVVGLRSELEELHAKLEKREPIPANAKTEEPVILLGENLTFESNPQIKIENPKSFYNETGNQLVLDFEIYNTHPQQKQIRGYIIALAKSPKGLFVYPQPAMTPNDNILIRYSKGETFAVSRFRVARATFDIPKDFADTNFQILLIGTNGKILVNYHYNGDKK